AALLIIGAPLFCSLIIREQKKRYLACRDKLGLTENDIQQALRHRKLGTNAVAEHPSAPVDMFNSDKHEPDR
ncbi:MAG: hypothetical protein LBB76_00035, partial [Azoarcus sp.]|nr:hypothetical protein [Azoarcus sp.]